MYLGLVPDVTSKSEEEVDTNFIVFVPLSSNSPPETDPNTAGMSASPFLIVEPETTIFPNDSEMAGLVCEEAKRMVSEERVSTESASAFLLSIDEQGFTEKPHSSPSDPLELANPVDPTSARNSTRGTSSDVFTVFHLRCMSTSTAVGVSGKGARITPPSPTDDTDSNELLAMERIWLLFPFVLRNAPPPLSVCEIVLNSQPVDTYIVDAPSILISLAEVNVSDDNAIVLTPMFPPV
ncbi:hypothetical protein BLNAU_18110 [Blattamonas nauphoetae]|uniref:Uncharacterized protein n=1 Tax=Blattamonas nauphoetae TaxID=2049346 RepID=A0ABQ9X5A1_9EUKA|nr:hypothetical protein BLNAU_18110 [Blattamonas nauphoetae]